MTIGIAFKKDTLSLKWSDRAKVRAVQMWTKHEYYHVEFLMKDHWISANTDGISLEKRRPLTSKYDYFFIDIDMTDEQLGILKRFIESQAGSEYDWAAIWMSQFLHIGINREDKWFCSELVVKILQICLIEEMLYLQPHLVNPGVLFDELKKMEVFSNVRFVLGQDIVDHPVEMF